MTTTSSPVAEPRITRVVPASALAFAVLFIAGAGASEAGGKTHGETAAQLLKNFHDSRVVRLLSIWLLIAAGLMFMPVAWGAMQRVAAGLSGLGEHMARTSAFLFTAMMLVGAGPGGALALTGVLDHEKTPSADLLRFLPPLSDPWILIGGALSAGVFLVVIARAGQLARDVPTWFSVLGYVSAVAMVGGVYAAPMFLLPIWALAFAVVVRT